MTRARAVAALLALAIIGGGVAATIGAGFVWLIDEGTRLVWVELPERVGVDPFGSWWIFAVPMVGGVLVGLGQRYVGNYPRPLAEAIATWRSGQQIPPSTAWRTAVNALVALVAGGPVGFEAALTGLIGGTATWVGRWIGSGRRLVRQAWGAEHIDQLPPHARQLPYWLAAVTGLLVFHWLPFGEIDVGFRFEPDDGGVSLGAGLLGFAFAAAIAVPLALAMAIVVRAEEALIFRRAPVLVAVGGAVVFAALALVDDRVLFSGQQAIQELESASVGDLAYLTVAKWGALVIALLAGWRGGPIFPLFTSAAALAALVERPFDVGPSIVMVAGVAAVSVVVCRGRVVVAFVLTLYVAPLAFAGTILIGCLGAAAALAIAGPLGLVPKDPQATDRYGAI